MPVQKPVAVLKSEKKSHRTKKELVLRKAMEDSTLTGYTIMERDAVKADLVAHKEFVRLTELLGAIGKNDAIYEQVINRYCILSAECHALQLKRDKAFAFVEKIEDEYERLIAENDKLNYIELKSLASAVSGAASTVLKFEAALQDKRKMLLAIEKENIMTVASALRTISKTPEPKKDPLLEALSGD